MPALRRDVGKYSWAASDCGRSGAGAGTAGRRATGGAAKTGAATRKAAAEKNAWRKCDNKAERGVFMPRYTAARPAAATGAKLSTKRKLLERWAGDVSKLVGVERFT
jgi:hypothetical protein